MGEGLRLRCWQQKRQGFYKASENEVQINPSPWCVVCQLLFWSLGFFCASNSPSPSSFCHISRNSICLCTLFPFCFPVRMIHKMHILWGAGHKDFIKQLHTSQNLLYFYSSRCCGFLPQWLCPEWRFAVSSFMYSMFSPSHSATSFQIYFSLYLIVVQQHRCR